MADPHTLETERLRLRLWRDEDLDAFAEMGTDVRVMEYFLSTICRAESTEAMARVRQHFDTHGYGLWAVEVKGGAPFIGFVGLQQVNFQVAFAPAVEIGWRLAFEAWGQGYASEAARAVLRLAFEEIALAEVVSFTAKINLRSRAVMERIGLRHDPPCDFEHPRIPNGHPIQRHVLYRISHADWASQE